MPDAVELTKAIKRIAVQAVGATKPAEICFGNVTGINPLRILVEQKMTLGPAQLVLAQSVMERAVELTVDWETAETGGGTGEEAFSPHSHPIEGRKRIVVHSGLAVGDDVILLRQQGGQKYIVLDRIGSI